tara:strand:- start:224 stop:424 length:201 start_codon:yes stop_codon:yes gene_type:complete
MNILNDQELAERLRKTKTDLAWWENKLAKSRKPSLIGIRSVHCSTLRKEIAEMKGIQFARHCAEQV